MRTIRGLWIAATAIQAIYLLTNVFKTKAIVLYKENAQIYKKYITELTFNGGQGYGREQFWWTKGSSAQFIEELSEGIKTKKLRTLAVPQEHQITELKNQYC